MHPIIMHELVKARTSDLHRQAERDALGLAARRARQAPAKRSTPFMPAHTTAALIRRVLTLLGARRRSLQMFKKAQVWARRRRLPRVSLAFCGVLSAALAAVVLVAAIAAPAIVIFLVGAVLGVLAGGKLCVHYLCSEIAADIDPQLRRMQNQLDVIESAVNLALARVSWLS
jgi:hypothetical protein